METSKRCNSVSVKDNFQNCYIPNSRWALPFAAHASFVSFFLQNLANMESKSGLCMCDSMTSYVYNMQVYTGREGQNREVNQRQRVVSDLLSAWTGEMNKKCYLWQFLRASVWIKNLLTVKWLYLEQYVKTKENYQQSWRRQEADRKTLLTSRFKIWPHLSPIALRRVELSSCSILSMTLQKLTTQKSQTQNGS